MAELTGPVVAQDAGRPGIDDVADAVFAALAVSLDVGLFEGAIEHRTTRFERDVDNNPYEERLQIDGVDYLVRVEQAPTSAFPAEWPNNQPPLIVNERGQGAVPDGPDGIAWQTVHAGVRVGFYPAPETGGAILHLIGGPEQQPAFLDDSVLFHPTREGLRSTIADLQSILAILPVPYHPVTEQDLSA